uniref:Uncharacterized protein n=1 Tax=Alexandrium monilatum TaxID=311494 RepID=A0A7S4V8Y1_9DINO
MAQDQPSDGGVAVQGEAAADARVLPADVAIQGKVPGGDLPAEDNWANQVEAPSEAVAGEAPETNPPSKDEDVNPPVEADPAAEDEATDGPAKNGDGEPAEQATDAPAKNVAGEPAEEATKPASDAVQEAVPAQSDQEVKEPEAAAAAIGDNGKGTEAAKPVGDSAEEAVPAQSGQEVKLDAAASDNGKGAQADEAPAQNAAAETAEKAEAPEAAKEVDPLEAVLPQDAPAGHAAWEVVRFCSNHKYPYAVLQIGSGADRVRFQATMMASGSQENAMRIARACFMLFDSGASLEDVRKFRNDLFERIKQVKEGKPPPKSTPKPPVEKEKPANGNGATANVPANEAATNGDVATKDKAPPAAKDKEPPAAKEVEVSIDMEDAPPDSAAHQKVKFDQKRDYHFFVIPGLEKERRVFTVSDKKYGTPFDECQRVCRICYLHFIKGLNKDEVTKIRDELLLKHQESLAKKGTPEATKLKRKSSVDMGPDVAEKAKAKEAKTEAKEAKEAKAEPKEGKPDGQEAPKDSKEIIPAGSPKAEAGPFIDEDAPPDSEAHGKVRWKKSTSCVCFKFKHADGSCDHFQATIKASGGDLETAMRITRLCYVKFEQGVSRQDIETYRTGLYAKVAARQGVAFQAPAYGAGKRKHEEAEGDAAESKKESKKEKPKKHSEQTSALLDQLRAEGRLAGAVRVEGRDPAAKNASINGLYAVVIGGYGSSQAYEKVGGSSPRFLFFSVKKKRWMINDELDDAKKGFAFAKTQDSGKTAPHEHDKGLKWQVFSGKEDGYAEDPAVRCVAIAAPNPVAKAAEEKKAAAEKEKAAVIARGATASTINDAGGSDDEDSGDSDSSSSSSGSDAEDTAGTAAPAATANGASDPTSASAVAAALRPTVAPGARRAPGRVCAKMLVTAGLRCHCHFAYRRDCPFAAAR